MNLLGFLSAAWQALKLIVGNELVNKAMDHWVAGTSNKIDDMVWKLIEQATGVADEAERKAMLEDGLAAIEAQYVTAKSDGTVASLKTTTKEWTPVTQNEIVLAMAGDFVDTNSNVG